MRNRPHWSIPTVLGAAVATMALMACDGVRSAPEPDTTEGTTTTAPSPVPVPQRTTLSQEKGVLVTFGDTTLEARLWDSPAARDLAARLPLTLTFGDYDAVEKTAPIEVPLTMNGMPSGDDPNPGEIGWYAPASVLVLYYGDVGYWNGIARIGTFDERGIALLAEGPREVTVTIARADA